MKRSTNWSKGLIIWKRAGSFAEIGVRLIFYAKNCLGKQGHKAECAYVILAWNVTQKEFWKEFLCFVMYMVTLRLSWVLYSVILHFQAEYVQKHTAFYITQITSNNTSFVHSKSKTHTSIPGEWALQFTHTDIASDSRMSSPLTGLPWLHDIIWVGGSRFLS